LHQSDPLAPVAGSNQGRGADGTPQEEARRPRPPGQQAEGPPVAAEDQSKTPDHHQPTDGASFQEQDAERRLGDFTGSGEHSRQQPGPLNDGDIHSQ
jgi:hypothetical protein